MNPYSIDSEGALVGPGAPFRIGVETVNKMNYAHRVGIAAGLRVAAEIVREYPLCNAIVERIISNAKEVEEAAKLETEKTDKSK